MKIHLVLRIFLGRRAQDMVPSIYGFRVLSARASARCNLEALYVPVATFEWPPAAEGRLALTQNVKQFLIARFHIEDWTGLRLNLLSLWAQEPFSCLLKESIE